MLQKKGEAGEDYRTQITRLEPVRAPLASGTKVAELQVLKGEEIVARYDLSVTPPVERIGFWGMMGQVSKQMFFPLAPDTPSGQ